MTDELTDPGAISALRSVAHPVRLRILSLLTAEAMSAAEVGRELEITHANASYHLRVLHEAGELLVESEQKIRGGMAKRYRYVVDQEPASGSRATNEDRIAYVRATAREITRRQSHHRPGGQGQFADIETWVTAEVWEEAIGLLRQVSQLLHDSASPARSEATKHISTSLFAFEMDDDS